VVEVALNPPLRKAKPIAPHFFPPSGTRMISVLEPGAVVEADPHVGSGPHLLRYARRVSAGAGRVFFAARQTLPKLVAVWVPSALDLAVEERDALDFHVFFHP